MPKKKNSQGISTVELLALSVSMQGFALGHHGDEMFAKVFTANKFSSPYFITPIYLTTSHVHELIDH